MGMALPKNPPVSSKAGNDMAPPGWSTVATVLVNIMKAQGFGYQTWSLISQRAIEITCFQFVDDTDLIHSTTDDSKPTADLLNEAQAALSTWEASCTALEVPLLKTRVIGTW